jgi:hypothetical protein
MLSSTTSAGSGFLFWLIANLSFKKKALLKKQDFLLAQVFFSF